MLVTGKRTRWIPMRKHRNVYFVKLKVLHPDADMRVKLFALAEEVGEQAKAWRMPVPVLPSAEERERRREVAAAELTNIDMDERGRRRLAGGAMSAVTAALATYLLASHAPTLTRAAIAPPLFLAYGFLASARTGL